jgi:hypothetical protein
MKNMVLNADFVVRRGVGFGGPHAIFGVDLNRFNTVKDATFDPLTNVATSTPDRVLPLCTTAQRSDITAQCSLGTIPVFHSAASSYYYWLHLRLDKRFSDSYQVTASYALTRYNTWNGIIDQVDGWHDSYGPNASDQRHRLNISGIWELPKYRGENKFLRGALNDWQLSGIGQFRTPGPINAVLGVDDDGDGNSLTYLQGMGVNSFGRSTSIEDLRAAVAAHNASVISRIKPLPPNATAAQRAACTFRHALLGNTDTATTAPVCGARTPRNQVIPLITLPENFSLRDTFITTDLRLTRRIKLTENVRLNLVAEGFNVFNVANLGGYTGDLTSTNFAQPDDRLNNAFGSGGPRAFQFAARVSF